MSEPKSISSESTTRRTARAGLGAQFRALFFKNLAMQKRQTKTNLCQVLVPFLLIALIGVIQVIVNHLLKSNPASAPLPVIARNIYNTVPCTEGADGPVCRVNDTISDFGLTNLTYFSEAIPTSRILYALPYFLYSAASVAVNASVGTLLDNGLGTALLGHIEPRFDFDYGGELSVPFYNYIGGGLPAINDYYINIQKYYYTLYRPDPGAIHHIFNTTFGTFAMDGHQENTVLASVRDRDFDKVRAAGAVYFEQVNETVLDYTVVARYHEIDKSGYYTQRSANIRNQITNAYLRNASATPDTARVYAYITNFPQVATVARLDIASLSGGFCYSFAASFLIPVFIAAIVKDKEERHIIMMQMSGLTTRVYWIISYVYNYVLYLAIMVMIFVTSLAFQFRIFTQTSAAVLLLLFFLWGNTAIVVSFFFSTMFDKTRTATVLGYLIVICSAIAANVVHALNIFPDHSLANPAYMLYPPFPFYRALLIMGDRCAAYSCFGASDITNFAPLQQCFVYMVVSTLLFAVITWYLVSVLPSEFGHQKSWHFIFSEPYAWLASKCGCAPHKKRGYSVVQASAPVQSDVFVDESAHAVAAGEGQVGSGYEQIRDQKKQTSAAATLGHNGDVPTQPHRPRIVSLTQLDENTVEEDVAQEAERIQRGDYSDACPVVLRNIVMTYAARGGKPAHRAVKGVSLLVDKSECFGLLGANGAGKTTLISVMTGLYPPTGGDARIAGFDLATEMTLIQHRLGVCPQFDVLSPDLSCAETLLFYARLKGTARDQEEATVARALQEVNLYETRHRLVAALSGGMKRRLSLAMSVIGDPDVVILDEPTTGLDPKSRQEVWEVVERVKANRSVILTTHMMEEADTLCTRVGIMSKGRLMCIGSQMHLKGKYGRGYEICFVLNAGVHDRNARSKHDALSAFIRETFPAFEHVETFADTTTYRVDKDDMVMSALFRLVEQHRHSLAIADWGVKMTTLEDVFVNICHRDE